MKVAIDLDHTLLDYSPVIPQVVTELNLPASLNEKSQLKSYIKDNTDSWPSLWIKAQGLMYGKFIHKAKFYENAIETINSFILQGITVEIVSHKSKVSYCKQYLLQDLATENICNQKYLSELPIKYCETKEDKIQYLKNNNFTIVIDDLQDILKSIADEKRLPIHFTNELSPFLKSSEWEIIKNIILTLKEIETPAMIFNTLSSKIIQTINGDEYFLKVFNDSQRYLREKDALILLDDSFNSPEVLSAMNNVIMTKGIQLNTYPRFDDKFLTLFQEVMTSFLKSKIIHKTTNHTHTHNDYFNNIEKRLLSIKDKNIKDKCNELLQELISIYPENLAPKINISYCYPDLYKGNLKLDNKSQLILLDFESMGLGDPARSFLNCVHHMEHEVELDEIDTVYQAFTKIYPNDKDLLERILFYYNIIALEWICIYYNYSGDQKKTSHLLNEFENKMSNHQKCFSWKEEIYQRLSNKM